LLDHLAGLCGLRPNPPLQWTPLRVERDQGFFENQKRLECDTALLARRR
jgi:hypothetical protein